MGAGVYVDSKKKLTRGRNCKARRLGNLAEETIALLELEQETFYDTVDEIKPGFHPHAAEYSSRPTPCALAEQNTIHLSRSLCW